MLFYLFLLALYWKTGARGLVADLLMGSTLFAITMSLYVEGGFQGPLATTYPLMLLFAELIGERIRALEWFVLSVIATLFVGAAEGLGFLTAVKPTPEWFYTLRNVLGIAIAMSLALLYGFAQDMKEEQRRLFVQTRERWTSAVSFQIRSPLAAIRGAVGLLKSTPSQMVEEDSTELIKVARRNLDSLGKLVSELLNMERLVSGVLELSKVDSNLGALLQQAMKDLSPQALENQNTIEYVGEPELAALVDPIRITQVAVALIENSIQYSPPGSAIQVSAERVGKQQVRVQVTDDGPGVPKAVQSLIFHRYRITEHHSSKQGLDLYVAKAIVEMHGGTIGFQNLTPTGCLFYFTLSA